MNKDFLKTNHIKYTTNVYNELTFSVNVSYNEVMSIVLNGTEGEDYLVFEDASMYQIVDLNEVNIQESLEPFDWYDFIETFKPDVKTVLKTYAIDIVGIYYNENEFVSLYEFFKQQVVYDKYQDIFNQINNQYLKVLCNHYQWDYDEVFWTNFDWKTMFDGKIVIKLQEGVVLYNIFALDKNSEASFSEDVIEGGFNDFEYYKPILLQAIKNESN